MIKKSIQLHWHGQAEKRDERTAVIKTLASLRKHGLAGTRSRLESAHEQLKEDALGYDIVQERYAKMKRRTLFIAAFLLALFYVMVIKVELYESRTALIVRDLTPTPPSAGLELSLLGAGPSSQLQDSKVVEEYLRSLDVYALLDEEFGLTKHFKSDRLDIIERLASDTTMEEVLSFYRKRIRIVYDELSGILHIAYAHPDPQVAQAVLKALIEQVEQELNEFNRRKARKQLSFIRTEHQKNREKMDASSAKLESYQNEHLLLDPNISAESMSSIITELEATLTRKSIELAKLSAYLNERNHEVVALRNEIKSIRASITEKRKGLSGSDTSRLNKVLFEYDRLKMELEFDTEVYKNSLIQLETSKLDALKAAKTLSVVSRPNLPDGYSYPNKPKVFMTLLIVLLLVYGVFSMLAHIIKDHKD